MTNQYPTTADTAITTGDKVRSYDFPSSVDHYVEGVVTGFDGVHYVIRVTGGMFDGEPCDRLVGHDVFPPINGQPTWGDKLTAGVVRI